MKIKGHARRLAMFLDIYGPALWFEEIDTDALDMSDPNLCALGQLYDQGGQKSGYYVGIRTLKLNKEERARFGFTLYTDNQMYEDIPPEGITLWDLLTEAVRGEIVMRLPTPQISDEKLVLA